MKRSHCTAGAAILVVLLCLGLAAPGQAGWLDKVKGALGVENQETASSTPETSKSESQELTTSEMTGGIKDALKQAIQTSVAQLGQQDGFLGNELVKIAMPEKLVQAENILRKIGQGALADQFIESMNRAAEKAVPKTASILGGAVKSMSIEEAANILKGADDAATQYFEEKTRTALFDEIKPVVHEATDAAQVTHYYKAMTDKAAAAVPLLQAYSPDLDQYVTGKALDGLFVIMAAEEKKIREDPVARGTDLLKKVFGNLGGLLN